MLRSMRFSTSFVINTNNNYRDDMIAKVRRLESENTSFSNLLSRHKVS